MPRPGSGSLPSGTPASSGRGVLHTAIEERNLITFFFVVDEVLLEILDYCCYIFAPARSGGASYSRPGLLNDLVAVCPERREILRRRRKIQESI